MAHCFQSKCVQPRASGLPFNNGIVPRSCRTAHAPAKLSSNRVYDIHWHQHQQRPYSRDVMMGAGGGSGGGGHGSGGGGGGDGNGGDGGGMPVPLNLHSITLALFEAKACWDKHDTDKSGRLNLSEAINLLQSKELVTAAKKVTNMDLPTPSRKDLERLFKAADKDRSGDLSQVEFLALFLASATHSIKTNPMVLADALMGFVDKDRNGKLDGRELKSVLGIVGVPPLLMMAIPDGVAVEYRGIMNTIGAALGGR